jgi:hypothetical protein
MSKEGIYFDLSFEHDSKTGRAHIPFALSTDTITTLLDIVNVPIWEKVNGQYIRLEVSDDTENPEMIRIGNIIHEQWFDLKTE